MFRRPQQRQHGAVLLQGLHVARGLTGDVLENVWLIMENLWYDGKSMVNIWESMVNLWWEKYGKMTGKFGTCVKTYVKIPQKWRFQEVKNDSTWFHHPKNPKLGFQRPKSWFNSQFFRDLSSQIWIYWANFGMWISFAIVVIEAARNEDLTGTYWDLNKDNDDSLGKSWDPTSQVMWTNEQHGFHLNILWLN